MQTEVIEFELRCSEHGRHKVIVPANLPRPRYCAHCYLPAVERRESGRYTIDRWVPDPVGPELYIG